MQNKIYYDINNNLIIQDLSANLLKLFGKNIPIIVCLGSDKVLSDMVGVFVADILKARNIKTLVFGGTKQNVNKNLAKIITKNVKNSNILFIDSGLLLKKQTIMVSNATVLNDGFVIKYPSITCSTICLQNNKINLANIHFKQVLKYSQIIADAICDYLSYFYTLSNKNI